MVYFHFGPEILPYLPGEGDLAYQLTLFKPGGGADYTKHITTPHPPSTFKNLFTPLPPRADSLNFDDDTKI